MSKDKYDYFIERTNNELQEIKSDVKKILEFRSQIIGGSVGLSFITSLVIAIIGFIITVKFGGYNG